MPEVILPCPACGSTDCECLVCTINADESQAIHFHMACNKCFTSGPIADDAESAKKLWNALPHSLTWTTEPPKVAGWYWMRQQGESFDIIQHYNQADIDGGFDNERRLKQWAGPIAPPVEG